MLHAPGIHQQVARTAIEAGGDRMGGKLVKLLMPPMLTMTRWLFGSRNTLS